MKSNLKIIANDSVHTKDLRKLTEKHQELYVDNARHIITTGEELMSAATKLKSGLFNQQRGEKVYSQSWPNPLDRNLPRQQQKENIWTKRHGFVSHDSKITSLGSCFAIEIAKWLQQNGFNYLQYDSAPIGEDGLAKSSVGWGTLFNTASILQTIRWAFDSSDRPSRLYQFGDKWADPFLEDNSFSSTDEQAYFKKVQGILSDSKKCLTTADICVITVGLNEVFEFLPNGTYFHRTPWGTNPAYYHPRDLSIDENIQNLDKAISILKKHNPKIKIIFSVSPVPLIRTFHAERHVAESTALSKSILRIAVDHICRYHEDCFYFASYETVMYPGKSIAFGNDFRHVTPSTISRIMSTFQQSFCSEKTRIKLQPNCSAILETIEVMSQQNPEVAGLLKLLEDAFQLSGPKPENSNLGYRLARHISFSTGMELNRCVSKNIRIRNSSHRPDHGLGSDLLKDGTVMIPRGFTEAESDFVQKFLETTFANSRDTKQNIKLSESHSYLTTELSNSGSGIFDFSNETIPNEFLESILRRAGILDLAKSYLGPLAYVISAGWRSYFIEQQSESDASLAAQLFHSDCDSLGGFLKIFVALSDINESNGPFEFVRGSHKERPSNLWHDGRINDQTIANNFGEDKVFVANCNRGDVYIADTLGLHKGGTVRSGFRDVLQIEVGNCKLGKPRDLTTPVPFAEWLD